MSYKDKDMLLDTIDTGDELKPFVRPQHWSESENEWKTTGEANPMPVVLKDNDEIFDIAERRVASTFGKRSEVRRAVNELQKLINESS